MNTHKPHLTFSVAIPTRLLSSRCHYGP